MILTVHSDKRSLEAQREISCIRASPSRTTGISSPATWNWKYFMSLQTCSSALVSSVSSGLINHSTYWHGYPLLIDTLASLVKRARNECCLFSIFWSRRTEMESFPPWWDKYFSSAGGSLDRHLHCSVHTKISNFFCKLWFVFPSD